MLYEGVKAQHHEVDRSHLVLSYYLLILVIL
jgi:hypothetical protein